MNNIVDYLKWRGDIPLSVAPFNPVDNLILSQFSYLSLENIDAGTIAGAAAELIEKEPSGDTDKNLPMLELMATSRRFGSARILHHAERFDEDIEMQFAALTIELDDGTACIAFRGTDATLVGWKEDFNMSFADEVPSQSAAVKYLNDSPEYTGLPLRVMGHSKGGNLAVYSSALCNREIQDRIIGVYSNDGPGLNDISMSSEGYDRIESRVHTFLPQSSVVGMLMNHPENYQVIHADGSLGIFQHDPYAWETSRDNFICEGGLRRGSLYTDRTVKDWIRDIPNDQRREFIDAVFSVLQETNARTMSELTSSWARNSVTVISAMGKLSPELRRHMHTVMGALISAGARNILGEPPAAPSDELSSKLLKG